MKNPYKTEILNKNENKLPEKMRKFIIPYKEIKRLIRNDVYSSIADVFTGIIEDESGTIKHEQKFADYESAILWCRGMISGSESDAYRLIDTKTKTCLDKGRMQGKNFVDYENVPEIEEAVVPGLENPITIDDYDEAVEKGTEEELEHARSVARTIAIDHLKQDPNYYKDTK